LTGVIGIAGYLGSATSPFQTQASKSHAPARASTPGPGAPPNPNFSQHGQALQTPFPSPSATALEKSAQSASPSPTPAQNWNQKIEKGQMPLASPSQLQIGLSNFILELRKDLVVNGTVISSEFKTVVFRGPGECLIEVFDASHVLQWSSYYSNSKNIIRANSASQQFSVGTSEARNQALSYLSLNENPKCITECREVAPGLWIPNTIEYAFGRAKRSMRSTVTSFTMNTQVDAYFSAWSGT